LKPWRKKLFLKKTGFPIKMGLFFGRSREKIVEMKQFKKLDSSKKLKFLKILYLFVKQKICIVFEKKDFFDKKSNF